nr:RNA-dependent RNA polymerase [Statovirus 0447]
MVFDGLKARTALIPGLWEALKVVFDDGPLGLLSFTTLCFIILMVKMAVLYKTKLLHGKVKTKVSIKGYTRNGNVLDEYVPNPTSIDRREAPKEPHVEAVDSWKTRIEKFVGFSIKSIPKTSFPKGKEEVIDGQPAKICHLESRRGFRINELVKESNITLPHITLAGNEYRRFTYFSTVVVPESYNDHIHTSLVKNYLCALIAKLDLNTVSLTHEPWLSHTGSNGSYIVTALHGKVINDYMPDILRCNLPCLFVIEDYFEGLHYDEEYCYICNKGNVMGISRGVESVWYDQNTKYFKNEHGNIGSTHKYKTLIRYGSQRLILLELGQTSEIPLQEYSVKTLNYNKEVHVNTDRCYIPSLCSEIVECETDTMPEFKVDTTLLAPHVFASKICFILNMLDTISDVVDCFFHFTWFGLVKLLFSVPLPTVVFSQTEFYFAVLFPWYYGVYSTLRYSLLPKFGFCRMNVDLSFNKLFIKGKYAGAFYDHLHTKDIGPDGLPYGFYYVDNYNIVRVPPGSIENYSNLIPVVKSFNTAYGHNSSNIPAKFNDLFGHNNISLDCGLAGAITPSVVSEIPVRMTVVDYKIDINVKSSFDYHLLSDLDYCKYGSSALTHDVVAGAASNRVLQPTPPQPNADVFFSLYSQFWNKYSHKAEQNTFLSDIAMFPQVPDLSSYSGKKRARMENGYIKHKKGAFYSTFVKNEALPLDTLNQKPVRIITPNTAAFNVEHRGFFHAFEEYLLNTTYSDGQRIFAKGLNFDERFNVINNLSSRYKYCFCCDFSNFDAHHRNNSYKGELYFYKALGLDMNTVKELVDAKKGGNIAYSLPSRCSGDLFTGSGNCLVIASMITSFSDEIRIFCDGDDTLVFSNDVNTGRLLVDYLNGFGFVLKVDKTITEYNAQSVDFCQVQYYVDRYYTVDLSRRINKAMNFRANSLEEAVRMCRGKIESLLPLTQLGVVFKYDGLTDLLDHIPISCEEVWYLSNAIKGMYHYQPERKCTIDLHEDAGLLGKLCQNLVKNKWLIQKATTDKANKIINRTIMDTLMEVSIDSVLEEKNCGSQSLKLGKYVMTSIQQLTHLGSTEWQVCTKTMKCMKLGSIGLVPIQDLVPEQSQLVTTPLIMTNTVMNQQSCLHKKEQRAAKYQNLDQSQSQRMLTQEPQVKDHAEDKTLGCSNSSYPSKHKKKAQSNSSLNMMQPSESLNSILIQLLQQLVLGNKVTETTMKKTAVEEQDLLKEQEDTSSSSKESQMKPSKLQQELEKPSADLLPTTEIPSGKSSKQLMKGKKTQRTAVTYKQNIYPKRSQNKNKKKEAQHMNPNVLSAPEDKSQNIQLQPKDMEEQVNTQEDSMKKSPSVNLVQASSVTGSPLDQTSGCLTEEK